MNDIDWAHYVLHHGPGQRAKSIIVTLLSVGVMLATCIPFEGLNTEDQAAITLSFWASATLAGFSAFSATYWHLAQVVARFIIDRHLK